MRLKMADDLWQRFVSIYRKYMQLKDSEVYYIEMMISTHDHGQLLGLVYMNNANIHVNGSTTCR